MYPRVITAAINSTLSVLRNSPHYHLPRITFALSLTMASREHKNREKGHAHQTTNPTAATMINDSRTPLKDNNNKSQNLEKRSSVHPLSSHPTNNTWIWMNGDVCVKRREKKMEKERAPHKPGREEKMSSCPAEKADEQEKIIERHSRQLVFTPSSTSSVQPDSSHPAKLRRTMRPIYLRLKKKRQGAKQILLHYGNTREGRYGDRKPREEKRARDNYAEMKQRFLFSYDSAEGARNTQNRRRYCSFEKTRKLT